MKGLPLSEFVLDLGFQAAYSELVKKSFISTKNRKKINGASKLMKIKHLNHLTCEKLTL
jgi:hypothetical protein